MIIVLAIIFDFDLLKKNAIESTDLCRWRISYCSVDTGGGCKLYRRYALHTMNYVDGKDV